MSFDQLILRIAEPGRRLAYAVLLALAVFATAKLGVELSRQSGNVAPIWLANAIPLAVMLMRPRCEWLHYVAAAGLGNFAMNFLNGDGAPLSLGFMASNLTEVVLAAALVRRFRADDMLISWRSALLFIGLAAAAATAIAASVGAGVASYAFDAPYLKVWPTWWIGHAVGILIVTPALVAIASYRGRFRPTAPAAAEFLLVVGGFAAAAYLGFPSLIDYSLLGRLALIATLPLGMWTAIRFGPAGAALANLIMAIAALMATMAILSTAGSVGLSPIDAVQSTQFRLLTLASTTLVIAVLIAERQRLDRRLRDAVECIGVKFAIFDADDRLVLANEQCRRADPAGDLWVPGARFEDIVRGKIARGLLPDATGRTEEWLKERLRQHRNPGASFEQQIGDGRWNSITEWRTNEGGTVGIWADISALKQEEAKIRGFLELAPDAMVIADQEDRIVLVNARAEQIFGYTRAEMVGQPVEMLIPEGVRAQQFSRRAAYFCKPQVRAISSGLDGYCLRKDGTEFPVEISIGPIETEAGILVSGTIRDITARKQNEAELVKATRATAVAEAASQAKSEFLSQMSHELRTPLNAVMGFAQMLQLDRDRTLSERQKEYCHNILRGGHNLLELINELLDLSRIEAGHLSLSPERLTVGDVLTHVRDTMNPLAIEADVRLEVSQAAGVPDISADDLRLRQILLNLVSNAIKYNQKGGSVLVTALAVPADRVRIIVTDTGNGIAPERQDEIFIPFNRLGAEYTAIEGTGIGLALSKKLVEAMAGKIGFTSKPGEGSTFWFELPAETAAAPAARPSAVEALSMDIFPRTTAGGYSLLYVEDNPASLRLMEHLVSTLPNVVMLAAPTPRLGLDLARAHRPDVIVLDLNLPEMNGLQVLARLKAAPETRDTPVIALTAAARPKDIQNGLAAGFFRYLTKPIDVKLFFAAVDDVLSVPAARRANGSH